MSQTPKDRQPPQGPKRQQAQTAGSVPAAQASPTSPPAEPPELQDLRKASAGLMYPSENDSPFDAFWWPAAGKGATSGQTARDQVAAHAKPGAKVEEVPVDRFFGDLEGSDDGQRFKQLRQVLTSRLSGLGVFRASGGEAEVDIYLVGRTRSGDWAGLHTVSVET